MVKKVCKDIDDIWLQAYTCKGNKENKSEEELKKIKENILNKKKEEKLELFSRSHFSNLENSITIKFNE